MQHALRPDFMNTRNCTIRKQAFCNQNVAKSIKIYPDYKTVPWKYQAVLEILRWCWKVKKVALRHSKMGRGEHGSRYMFLKLPKTITLVRKRWFFSKVLRKQDGQEYLSLAFHYQQMTFQKWPWESCMTKGSSLTLLSAIKTHTRDRNSLLRPHFLTIPVVLWWLIIQQYSIIFMAEIIE